MQENTYIELLGIQFIEVGWFQIANLKQIGDPEKMKNDENEKQVGESEVFYRSQSIYSENHELNTKPGYWKVKVRETLMN